MESGTEHLALYNRPEFSSLNVQPSQRYRRIDFRSGSRFVGSLAGVVDADSFVSGFSAGFGGADFFREHERLTTVMEFVAYCLATLESEGIRNVVIRSKPSHYSPNEPYLQFALLRHGFSLAQTDLNFFIDLTRYATADDYVAALRHAPRRQVKIALATDHCWRQADDHNDWHRGYEVLAQSRQRHGASLSLSFDYIMRLRAHFPHRVHLYLLERADRAVAASLVYEIIPRAVQVMYWGDAEHREVDREEAGSQIAIMNLLAYKMVEQALSKGWHSLDLGPSTSPGTINFGNCAFKTTIGAEPGFRSTFVRNSSIQ